MKRCPFYYKTIYIADSGGLFRVFQWKDGEDRDTGFQIKRELISSLKSICGPNSFNELLKILNDELTMGGFEPTDNEIELLQIFHGWDDWIIVRD